MTNDFHLENAKRIAHLLDSRFEILGVKVGLDPILDLIPVVGDMIATGLALYIIYVAVKFRLPPGKIARMIFNIFLDSTLDAIPIIGNIGTIFFRSNRMNADMLEEYLQEHRKEIEEGQVVG